MSVPDRFLPKALAAALVALAGACQHIGAGAPEPAQAETAGNIDRQQAETHLRLAQALEQAGDQAGAVADYTAALRYDGWPASPGAEPGEGTPYAGLARLCTGDAPPEVIVRACAGAVDIGRFSPERIAVFFVNRGEANAELEEYRKALADFRAARTLDPANPEVDLATGQLHERMGDDQAALRAYRLALLRRPDSAPVRFARGRLRMRLGDFDGATADFDAILSNPETLAANPAAYGDRALAHCRAGRPEAAEVDWRVWIGADPEASAATRELLATGGYVEPAEPAGFDQEASEALVSWIAEGCPEG